MPEIVLLYKIVYITYFLDAYTHGRVSLRHVACSDGIMVRFDFNNNVVDGCKLTVHDLQFMQGLGFFY